MTEEDIDLKKYIRTVQGFPTSGIDYKDVMPLFADAKAFSKSIDQIAKYYEKEEINYVAGIEARGFLIASALSIQLGAGLLAIRKTGKLPGPVIGKEYELEYGSDRLELQENSFPQNSSVLIVDDVLASGGTANCAASLVNLAGGKISGFAFLISLDFLEGRKRISGYREITLLRYE